MGGTQLFWPFGKMFLNVFINVILVIWPNIHSCIEKLTLCDNEHDEPKQDTLSSMNESSKFYPWVLSVKLFVLICLLRHCYGMQSFPPLHWYQNLPYNYVSHFYLFFPSKFNFNTTICIDNIPYVDLPAVWLFICKHWICPIPN